MKEFLSHIQNGTSDKKNKQEKQKKLNLIESKQKILKNIYAMVS